MPHVATCGHEVLESTKEVGRRYAGVFFWHVVSKHEVRGATPRFFSVSLGFFIVDFIY